MLKRMMATRQSAAARVAQIGLTARKGLVAVAGTAVAAGLFTLATADWRPAPREAVIALETGRAIQHRPSATELSEALGAFDRFRDQPETVKPNGQRLALSTASR